MIDAALLLGGLFTVVWQASLGLKPTMQQSTDTPLELPLTNFAADGEDWFDAVQNWIAGIGA